MSLPKKNVTIPLVQRTWRAESFMAFYQADGRLDFTPSLSISCRASKRWKKQFLCLTLLGSIAIICTRVALVITCQGNVARWENYLMKPSCEKKNVTWRNIPKRFNSLVFVALARRWVWNSIILSSMGVITGNYKSATCKEVKREFILTIVYTVRKICMRFNI